ncbi:hypothetical protein [Oceanirhabdus sp. W0125-5]|uniref:hypothetical protein n=1 Tax=Oceanirhabdus sp. W0125-5 TaxID=2999116 RepID=UPI0022F2EE74|nr:hypothetical protein [Oceanirhabdus sp. W0125-5]WBW97341.1 hypothetical protein OW730_00370 [Oceanirhabdus sp. W0125-5]
MAIKLKDGKKYFYSEAQSQQIARHLNYVKLLQILTNGSNMKSGSTIKILNQVFLVENIKSFEFFL